MIAATILLLAPFSALFVATFWDESGLSPCVEFYDVDENRCEVCGKVYKRAQDLKAHKTKVRHHVNDFTKVTATAKKAAMKKKLEKV